ncbi:hypothetical protein Lgra_1383 [Legionella gratiana]|uniref:Uncharacterized protein n=1 Tax=Legionella gratiana TaxID=45066 RepID=A0A378JNX4_9GAMM|nr:hypothetical protein [Legionella gratiana]KTD11925.1 hypothetical protein Lgra_1383 [Legionella gratiana]STX46470.1 Uncharacterised protein [Legionella gratiana]
MQTIDELVNNASTRYRNERTLESYTLLCSIVNSKNERKWLNGDYNDELNPISEKMRDIEIQHGLKDDETFFISEAPKSWLDLDKQYNQIIFEKLSEIFCTIGFPEIGKEIKENSKEFHNKLDKYNIHLRDSIILIKKGTSLINKIKDEMDIIFDQNNIELSTYLLLTYGIESAICLIMFKSYLSFIDEFEKRKKNDINYKNKKPYKLSIGDLLDIFIALPTSPFNELEEREKRNITEYLSCIRNDYHHPWRFVHKEVRPNQQEIINLKKAFDDLVACVGVDPG